MIVILMGVSGCGKTTVGRLLAQRLGWPFFDGDDFHSSANVAKMGRGMPLDDADRQPWLERLRGIVAAHLAQGGACILACSALKRRHRETLRQPGETGVSFVHLNVPPPTLARRLRERSGHFFQAELLDSQLAALEPAQPTEGVWKIDADQPPERIAAQILTELGLAKP